MSEEEKKLKAEIAKLQQQKEVLENCRDFWKSKAEKFESEIEQLQRHLNPREEVV